MRDTFPIQLRRPFNVTGQVSGCAITGNTSSPSLAWKRSTDSLPVL